VGITKHGVGDIIPEPEDNQKTAKADWDNEDEAELQAELAEDAPE
jgi:hypothetical protein